MTNEELKVLTNIIGAVETGGQVYGKQDYSCYVPPYKNSPNEHTITLGAFCQYGSNAKKLIQMIYEKDKSNFTQSIIQKLNVDWVATRWNPSSTDKNTLIKIISSNVGKQCQDEMFQKQVQSTIDNAISMRVTDVGCQIMYVEIAHLGGDSAAKRIFNKAPKPYTVDGIFNTLLLDQKDTSNNNQVGDKIFQSRHECCVKWIKQYLNSPTTASSNSNKTEGDNMANVTEKAIQWMENAANDSSHGYDQAYRWGEKGDYDCSSAVITAWQNAGVPVKTKGATYTGNMYNVFLACGFKDVTNSVNLSNGSGLVRGDVLLNHQKHVAMYCGNGKEVEASINEKGTATGGKPGDQTGKEFLIRSYRNYPWNVVLRYSGSGASSGGSSSSTTTRTYLQKGDTGNDVKTMQKMLIAIGYSCGSCGADGDFGNDTLNALKKFQADFNLEVDGLYGANSKAKLESEYKNKTSNNNSNNASNNKKVDPAQYYDKSLAGTYKVKTALYIRCGAGKETPSLDVMEKGAKVQCYGYYSVASDGVKWLYVVYKDITGFASSTYLKKA